MSPGVDFESRLFAKPNAAELLAKELSAPGYVPQVIAMPSIGDKAQALQDRRGAVSIEKAKRLLDWEPRYSWRSLLV